MTIIKESYWLMAQAGVTSTTISCERVDFCYSKEGTKKNV